MQWEEQAESRLQKAPFFVRKKVKKLTEDYVRSQGRDVVTTADLSNAKSSFFGKSGNGNTADKQQADSQISEDIPVSAEEINRLEKMVETGEVMEGLESKHHSIRLCGGAVGCPLTVVDDKNAAQIMLDVIKDTKLAEDIAGKLGGTPVLSHHKFKGAVAGCPNSCSEPQIKDFAVIGQRKPIIGNIPCSGCGLCIKACREKALVLQDKQIRVLYDNCLNCGLCIEACPKGTLVEGEIGYKITVGGRLGRHPRLAETLVDMAGNSQLRQVMTNCLQLLKEDGRSGERFSHLVERYGLEELKRRVLT